MSDIVGGDIKTLIAFHPRALSGEVAHSGAVIDRRGFESVVFNVATGEYTSDPTGINIECKVQQCATAVGVFADVTDLTDVLLPVIHTHISGEVTTMIPRHCHEINMDLRPCNRYIKLVVTPEFAGGTTPAVYFAATAVLGEPKIKPAV